MSVVRALALALALTTPVLPSVRAAATPASVAGSIVAGGLQRTFRLYVPASHDRTRPVPLVIALHGGGGTGAGMERLTTGGLNRLAGRDGFVVVYPDGVERHWNDGRGIAQYRSHRDNIDDVGFVNALVDHLVRTQAIDRRRVYAAGISNGGLLAQRLARELAPRITAVGVVAISMSDKIAQMRPPARPISVLIMPGTDDPLVPWNGGEIASLLGRDHGRVLSVAQTVSAWTTHNRCPGKPDVTREPDRDPGDGTRVRREIYAPCAEGTEVALYVIEGGGHGWPGGWPYLPERIIGRTSRDIDANEVLWAFFKRHAIR